MTLLRKIENEAKQFIEQLHTSYRGIAEQFIPSVIGFVQHNNRAIEQHRSQASCAGGEDGGSSGGSGSIGEIAASATKRIAEFRGRGSRNIFGAGYSLAKTIEERLEAETPSLKPN